MSKRKHSATTSELIKGARPVIPGDTLVIGHHSIQSVPFDQLDERTQRKFARNQEIIENYEPCFGFGEQHEFIKPPKTQATK